MKSLEKIIIQHYQEISFSGKGTKISSSDSKPINKDNPFNILFKRHHVLIPQDVGDFPVVPCEIVFKLMDGNTLKAKFMTNDTIGNLYKYIKETRKEIGDFQLVNTYPRKYSSPFDF
jgi:hypothetical protein